ncbi:MAG: hypothetical protein M1825_003993 [Sarcosagium campestre]|nr:MAG: hypothetical protein M1825_003993 [Sarcosagium campestre]
MATSTKRRRLGTTETRKIQTQSRIQTFGHISKVGSEPYDASVKKASTLVKELHTVQSESIPESPLVPSRKKRKYDGIEEVEDVKGEDVKQTLQDSDDESTVSPAAIAQQILKPTTTTTPTPWWLKPRDVVTPPITTPTPSKSHTSSKRSRTNNITTARNLKPTSSIPSLLDRIRAKQKLAPKPPPPSATTLLRIAALDRLPDIIPVLSLLGNDERRVSLPLPLLHQRLRDSLRNPISRDECAVAVSLLAREVLPDWIEEMAVGDTAVIVVKGGAGEKIVDGTAWRERIRRLRLDSLTTSPSAGSIKSPESS